MYILSLCLIALAVKSVESSYYTLVSNRTVPIGQARVILSEEENEWTNENDTCIEIRLNPAGLGIQVGTSLSQLYDALLSWENGTLTGIELVLRGGRDSDSDDLEWGPPIHPLFDFDYSGYTNLVFNTQHTFNYYSNHIRSYWKNHVMAPTRWSKSEFTLPDPRGHHFIFIQYWILSEYGTVEFGLKSRGSIYTPLVFSTDDMYKSGWFGKKKIEWVPGGKSKCRVKEYFEDSASIELAPGTHVRLTVNSEPYKDKTLYNFWIQGNHVASLKMKGQEVKGWDFGVEVNYMENPPSLTDLDIDYD